MVKRTFHVNGNTQNANPIHRYRHWILKQCHSIHHFCSLTHSRFLRSETILVVVVETQVSVWELEMPMPFHHNGILCSLTNERQNRKMSNTKWNIDKNERNNSNERTNERKKEWHVCNWHRIPSTWADDLHMFIATAPLLLLPLNLHYIFSLRATHAFFSRAPEIFTIPNFFFALKMDLRHRHRFFGFESSTHQKNSYARCELNFHRMCAAMNISDWFLAIFVSSLLNRNIHRFSMAVIIFECVMCAIIIFCSRPFCIFKPFGCMKSSTILEDVHFKYSRHNHNRSHINFCCFLSFR